MAKARARAADFLETGLAHARAGRHGEAIACFETVLAREPGDIRALFALGNTAETIGHADAAETFFRRVLAQEPDRLEALVNLANLLRTRGRTADTVVLLKGALERNPNQADLWLTLGSALREAGDTPAAGIFYREALRLAPDSAPALGNLADLVADGGNIEEALALYGRAMESEPENAQARFNRALLYLFKGDLENGWCDYEYRLRIKKRTLIADHGLKRWKGNLAPGLKLLVTAEQGIGDQIMFASLIPELSERISRLGGKLLLEAEPRLVPLFARSFPDAGIHGSNIEERGGKKLAHYPWLKPGSAKAAIELGSLPRHFRRSLAEFPASNCYLKPDPAEQERLGGWLRARANGPTIGICWRSGLTGGLRTPQYAPLSAWAEFIRDLEFTPVSLQYDAREDEIAALQQMSGRDILVPPFDQKREIDIAASLIASLDLVASAPTSVGWIAAGLGVPTLKILSSDTWTAFGTGFEPFAPAARIVAPERSGDWPRCFSKALDLVKMLAVSPRLRS